MDEHESLSRPFVLFEFRKNGEELARKYIREMEDALLAAVDANEEYERMSQAAIRFSEEDYGA